MLSAVATGEQAQLAAAERQDPGGSASASGDAPGPGVVSVDGWIWGDEGAGVPAEVPLHSLVSVAVRLLAAFIGYTAQGLGISPAGLGVMRLLAARDGLKSSEVAARGWWTAATVTSVVDTLVRDGYVERRRDTDDRRVVRLHLTEQGRRKAVAAGSVIGPRWQAAFGYVDPADEPVIRKFLAETIERFSTLVREERGK
jgi:DNA-binding MarR family transcriptional regulator